jgi:hypothetical protein
MSRKVSLVLLCEDSQHEVFVRRFLKKAGWSDQRPRVEKAPKGRGSAEQFVRERFPKELSAYRANRNLVAQGLIVVCDGDSQGVKGRLDVMASACAAEKVPPRKDDEKVAFIIPTWNIETWFAYLDGSEVDEGKRDYPKLDRPRKCQTHVDRLYEMCRQGLRKPVPASLEAACAEYKRLKSS